MDASNYMIEDFLLRIYLFLSSVIDDLGCVKKLNKLNLRSEKKRRTSAPGIAGSVV